VSDVSQTYATDVAASPQHCFDVLVDFADYPRWSSPITECEVIERWPDGLPKRVAFALDMTIRTIRYVLEYHWTPPEGGTWRMVSGDLAGVEGEYRFTPLPDGRTRATCSQAIDLGFWLPGFLRSTAEKKALRDSVEEFRAAAEARAARG